MGVWIDEARCDSFAARVYGAVGVTGQFWTYGADAPGVDTDVT
jgi:membrane glycosyltransferase